MSVTHFDGERTSAEGQLTSVADPRRRAVLAALRDEESAVDRRTLAEQVVAIENDVAPSSVREQAVDDALVSLHHVHLPKLDDAGYLTYDAEESSVEPRTVNDGAVPLLAEF